MTAASAYGFTTRVLPFTCEREVYRWNGSHVYQKSTVRPSALM